MKRTEFPPELYLCTSSRHLGLGEGAGVPVFEPHELTYWTGRFRGYDGRFHSAADGGWYCEECLIDLLEAQEDLERAGPDLPVKLYVEDRDIGPKLDEAIRDTRNKAREKAKELVSLLDRMKEIDQRVGRHLKAVTNRSVVLEAAYADLEAQLQQTTSPSRDPSQ